MIYDAIRMNTVSCNCGRPANKTHCPYCGSFDTRARAQLKVSKIDPATEKLQEYQVHRCRKCGKLFDEHQLITGECKASEPVLKGSIIQGLDVKSVRAAMNTGLVNAGKKLPDALVNNLMTRAETTAATKQPRVWTKEEEDEAMKRAMEEE